MGMESGDGKGKSAEICKLKVSLARKDRSGHREKMSTSPHEMTSW